MPFDFSKYLFPEEALEGKTTEELRGIIAKKLSTACHQPDGCDHVMPEVIDYAQDLIRQCRDLLAERGELFSDTDKTAMGFLHWGGRMQLDTQQNLELAHRADKAMMRCESHLRHEEMLRHMVLGETQCTSRLDSGELGLQIIGSTSMESGPYEPRQGQALRMFDDLVKVGSHVLPAWQLAHRSFFVQGEHLRYACFSIRTQVTRNAQYWKVLGKWAALNENLTFILWSGTAHKDVTVSVMDALSEAGYLETAEAGEYFQVAKKPAQGLWGLLKSLFAPSPLAQA